MWEQFMNCLTKNAKTKCKFPSLSELQKRVPPNQQKQFQLFKKKNEEYKERLQKYPNSLPKIDWKYYEANVRPEYKTWVKHFQNQYEQFDTFFENRHALIDATKYFCEVEEEKKEVQEQVAQFKKESNKRIRRLKEQIKTLKLLRPYTEMTMEEFCLARPDAAPDFINKPTFWPHTPEEQIPGPSDPHAVVEEEEPIVQAVKPKDEPPKTPPDPTPKTLPPGPPASTPPKDAKFEEKKDPQSTTVPPPDKKTDKDIAQENVCDVGEGKMPMKTTDQKTEAPIDVEKMKETASELLAKGSVIAADLAQKAKQVIKEMMVKLNEKRKQVEEAANKAREENKARAKYKEVESKALAASKPTVDPEEVDSIYFREGSKHICHQTIIKGDDETNVEVKPKHTNLNEEEQEEIQQTEKKFKKKPSAEKLNKDDIEAMEKRAHGKKRAFSQELNKEPSYEACQNESQEKPAIDCLKTFIEKDSEKQKECREKLREEECFKKEIENCLKKQKEKEECLRKQKEEEECLRKQKEEEEWLRKQKEEEECLRKQKEEECLRKDQEKESMEKQDYETQKIEDTKQSENPSCFQSFIEKEFQKRDKETKPQSLNEEKIDCKTPEKKDPEKCSLNLESTHSALPFQSPEPVDAIGLPKTPIEAKPQEGTKNNEKASLEDLDDKLSKKSIFVSPNKKTMKKDNQFDFPHAEQGEKALNRDSKKPASDDVYAGTQQTELFLKNVSEEKKLAGKEKNAQLNSEEERDDNEEAKDSQKDEKVTFYPKLMINTKAKNEQEASSSSEEAPTKTPAPAKELPANQKAFIPRTSTTPVAPPPPPPVETKRTTEVLESAQEVAKKVYRIATDAAALLTDATKAVEEAKKVKPSKLQKLEAAYLAAQIQANRALAEAYKAMEAAKKLTKRSRRSQEEQNRDPDALQMAEKHALLAKLLARRAIALKKEIAKVLEELKEEQKPPT